MTVDPQRPQRPTKPRHHVGARLHHRRRGDSALRNGTSLAIVGGLVVATAFSLMAFRTTQAHDQARAEARARALAYEQHQYALRQAAIAQLKAAALAAKVHAQQVASLDKLRAAEAAAQAAAQSSTQTQTAAASSAAAVAAANAAAANAAAAQSASSGAGSAATAV